MLKSRIVNLAVAAATLASALALTTITGGGASAAATTPAAAAHSSGYLSSSAAAREGIYNFSSTIGCVVDLGHGNLVYTASSGCAYINFIDPVTEDGYTWYLIEMNGNSGTCLNYDINNDFVYADSCTPHDPSELWEHHVSDQLVNLESSAGFVTSIVTGAPSIGALEACTEHGNTPLITYFGTDPEGYPVACAPFDSSIQWKWKIQDI